MRYRTRLRRGSVYRFMNSAHHGGCAPGRYARNVAVMHFEHRTRPSAADRPGRTAGVSYFLDGPADVSMAVPVQRARGAAAAIAAIERAQHACPSRGFRCSAVGGCAAWSCIDAGTSDERILVMDSGVLTLTKFNLFSWLEAWASGVDLTSELWERIFTTMINPFTREPMTVQNRVRTKGVVVWEFG
jgi:hypothetical protein